MQSTSPLSSASASSFRPQSIPCTSPLIFSVHCQSQSTLYALPHSHLSCKVDFLFLCDIVINFRTVYYNEDFEMVLDLKAIRRRSVQTAETLSGILNHSMRQVHRWLVLARPVRFASSNPTLSFAGFEEAPLACDICRTTNGYWQVGKFT